MTTKRSSLLQHLGSDSCCRGSKTHPSRIPRTQIDQSENCGRLFSLVYSLTCTTSTHVSGKIYLNSELHQTYSDTVIRLAVVLYHVQMVWPRRASQCQVTPPSLLIGNAYLIHRQVGTGYVARDTPGDVFGWLTASTSNGMTDPRISSA